MRPRSHLCQNTMTAPACSRIGDTPAMPDVLFRQMQRGLHRRGSSLMALRDYATSRHGQTSNFIRAKSPLSFLCASAILVRQLDPDHPRPVLIIRDSTVECHPWRSHRSRAQNHSQTKLTSPWSSSSCGMLYGGPPLHVHRA